MSHTNNSNSNCLAGLMKAEDFAYTSESLKHTKRIIESAKTQLLKKLAKMIENDQAAMRAAEEVLRDKPRSIATLKDQISALESASVDDIILEFLKS